MVPQELGLVVRWWRLVQELLLLRVVVSWFIACVCEGRVDGAGCGRVAWFVWTVVCWSFGSGVPLYVAGGWRWGLPVANRPSLVRRVPLELSVE